MSFIRVVQKYLQKTADIAVLTSFFAHHVLAPAAFFLTPAPVFAQEATVSAEVQSTPTPTPEPVIETSPSPEPLSTEEPTPSPQEQEIPSTEIRSTPEPTEVSSPEPTVIPSSEPTPQPSPQPEEKTEEPNFTFQDDTAHWKTVSLNETYRYPQDERVSLTFTQLPGAIGDLTIKKVVLTQEQVEQSGALDQVGYEITSSMTNGTFRYNLTLPKPQQEAVIAFAQDMNEIGQPERLPQTLTENSILKIADLDHFTVFIVTDLTPATTQAPESAPEMLTVYPNDSSLWYYYADENESTYPNPPQKASVTFVAGPTDPAHGDGSVRLQSGSAGTKAIIRTLAYDGTLVEDISELSFNSYTTSNPGANGFYINLYFDTNNDGEDDLNKAFVFANDVVLNTWQSWDLTTRPEWASIPAGAKLVSPWPGGGAIAFNVGDSAANYLNVTTHIDGVRVVTTSNDKTYDFESLPITTPAFIPTAPVLTGWKKMGEAANNTPSIACLDPNSIQWSNNSGKIVFSGVTTAASV